MHLYTPFNIKDIMKSKYLYNDFNADRIKEIADSLTPENSLIYL